MYLTLEISVNKQTNKQTRIPICPTHVIDFEVQLCLWNQLALYAYLTLTASCIRWAATKFLFDKSYDKNWSREVLRDSAEVQKLLEPKS